MNLPHDSQVAEWLAAGSAEAPPESLARALAATRRTRKRPRWTFPERWLPVQLTMTRTPSLRPILSIVVLAVLIVALIATALFIGSQRRALPPPFGPARNGAIVYSERGDLFIADQLNGTPRLLVGGPERDTEPIFSDQGDRVAFVRDGQDGRRVMSVSPDGSDQQELSTLLGAASLSWSPDGSVILATSGVLENGNTPKDALHFIKTDGSGSRTIDLATRSFSHVEAFWRPGGRHIILLNASGSGVFIADADGTNIRRLGIPSEGLDLHGLAWSPDGKHLSFMSDTEPQKSTISIADIDEDGALTDLRRLKIEAEVVRWTDPAWAPDGSQLAFVLEQSSSFRVAIANADGSGYRLVGPEVDGSRLTGPDIAPGGVPKRAIDVIWAPDGRSLVMFEHPFAGESDVPVGSSAKAWSVDVATGQQTEVQSPVATWQRLAP
jgi:Tol biopolymer transport system component